MKRFLGILGTWFAVPGILLFAAWKFLLPPQSQSEEDLFALGEYLSLEARWDESREVLRRFLLDNPEHPGAHFYLGRSYLLWADDFRPAIAEGELQTALALYHENGGHHYVERFPDTYFQVICNIESGKVCLRQFTLLLEAGFPPRRLTPIVTRARGYLEAARTVHPDHIDIGPFEDLVETMESVVGNGELTAARR